MSDSFICNLEEIIVVPNVEIYPLEEIIVVPSSPFDTNVNSSDDGWDDICEILKKADVDRFLYTDN